LDDNISTEGKEKRKKNKFLFFCWFFFFQVMTLDKKEFKKARVHPVQEKAKSQTRTEKEKIRFMKTYLLLPS